MSKRVIVFGGDGFCGWPTSLHLSNSGYDVAIVDNLSRRKIDVELAADSLTPIASIENRIAIWKEVSGKDLTFADIDISTEYDRLESFIADFAPDAVVHFAEQRAAPYSMKSPKTKRYTVSNNLNATHNVLVALAELGLDTHVVHLGTMGVYGYDTGLPIPEGYLNVQAEDVDGPKQFDILFPPNPGSVYHMTKTQDALLFKYYNKNDAIRITDLHQGIVWGTNTPETSMHEGLVNRFDYDGDYGTVLNRFLMQSAVGHPLTVHGTGGQTRAFIHIRDTANCVRLAIENPPAKGDRVEIFNQVTEVHTVHDLAKMISEKTGAEIRYYENPRKEAAENNLVVAFDKFLDLGLDPITLDDGLFEEVRSIASKYKDRCDMGKVVSTSAWRNDMTIDRDGSETPVGESA